MFVHPGMGRHRPGDVRLATAGGVSLTRVPELRYGRIWDVSVSARPRAVLRGWSRVARRRHLRIHRLPRRTQRGAGRVAESAGDRLARRDALGPIRVDRSWWSPGTPSARPREQLATAVASGQRGSGRRPRARTPNAGTPRAAP